MGFAEMNKIPKNGKHCKKWHPPRLYIDFTKPIR